MSLINDMLRELDRRGVDTPLLPAVNRTAAPPPRRRRHVIVLLVLLLAAFGAWLMHRGLAPAPAISALTVQPPPATGIVSAGSAPLPRSDTAQAESAAVPPAMSPAAARMPDDAQPVIAAPTAVVADSSPGRIPAVAAATAPMPRVVTTEPAQAAPSPPVKSPAPVTESPRPTPSSPSPLASLQTRDAVAVDAAGDPTRPVSAVDAAPPAVAEPVQRLSIQRHHDSPGVSHLDMSELLQQASDALAADRDDEARQLLQQVLERAPTQHQARLSLAGLHAERGRVDDAIALLEVGLVLAPRQAALAERLGRLRLLQGEPVRAAAILVQALPPLAEQPSHHALLALAWHQAGQPASSARIYQALLRHDPKVGPWWLGLALARDALGERAAARAAFAQAQLAGGLDDSVLRYMRQRVAEIEASSP